MVGVSWKVYQEKAGEKNKTSGRRGLSRRGRGKSNWGEGSRRGASRHIKKKRLAGVYERKNSVAWKRKVVNVELGIRGTQAKKVVLKHRKSEREEESVQIKRQRKKGRRPG